MSGMMVWLVSLLAATCLPASLATPLPPKKPGQRAPRPGQARLATNPGLATQRQGKGLTTRAVSFDDDNDSDTDENGEFTGVVLEKPNLPPSFTVCTAYNVLAWKTQWLTYNYWIMNDDNGGMWAFINPASNVGDVTFGIRFGPLEVGANDPGVYFPLRWMRSCTSLDVAAGKVKFVLNGKLLGEYDYNPEEDTRRPSKLFLFTGYDAINYQEDVGHVTNINIFSSALAVERMEAATLAGGAECGAPGDYVNWEEEQDWSLRSAAKWIELEEWQGPCQRESAFNVFTAEFKTFQGCMHHCQKIGKGRSPPVGTLKDWQTYMRELEILSPDISQLPYMHIAGKEGTDMSTDGVHFSRLSHWPETEVVDGVRIPLEAIETVWRDYYTGERFEQFDYPFYGNHPDKYDDVNNCLALFTDEPWAISWFEYSCYTYGQVCPCQYQNQPKLLMRGLCPSSKLITVEKDVGIQYTPKQLPNNINNVFLLGAVSTRIDYNDILEQWKITDAMSSVTAVSRASKVSYVLGKHTWYITNDAYGCHDGEPYFTELKLTGCDQEGEFTCSDGQCITMDQRCDQQPNCRDKSDEKNCQLLVLEDNYNWKVPPITTVSNTNFTIVPVPVFTSITLMKIVSIEEVNHMITLQFGIVLQWREVRATFFNLKHKTSLNALSDSETAALWLPYAIFDNTDDKEAVQLLEWVKTTLVVSREGEYSRSGPTSIDEIEMFKGSENSLSLSQTHSKKFQCQYKLSKYPFDTQVCSIKVVSSSLDAETIKFIPKDVVMKEMLDLTMYIIKQWDLIDDGDGSVKFIVVLERKFMSELLGTYLPTILLLGISYATVFFKAEYFEAALTVNLTNMLVLTTIFISVIQNLPRTAYVKHIDTWLIFCQLVPFLEVILITAAESLRMPDEDEELEYNHHGHTRSIKVSPEPGQEQGRAKGKRTLREWILFGGKMQNRLILTAPQRPLWFPPQFSSSPSSTPFSQPCTIMRKLMLVLSKQQYLKN